MHTSITHAGIRQAHKLANKTYTEQFLFSLIFLSKVYYDTISWVHQSHGGPDILNGFGYNIFKGHFCPTGHQNVFFDNAKFKNTIFIQ